MPSPLTGTRSATARRARTSPSAGSTGTVTPGARLAVGDALLQVSAYAIPCAKNAGWFSDGDFQRLSHEVNPAGSRLYASVVREGAVRVGDAVVLEP